MFIPLWLLVVIAFAVLGLATATYLLAAGRIPLPFPDPGSRIFSAPTPGAKEAVVALLGRHGLRERVRFDSSGILRSILQDGTIVNCAPPEILRKLDSAGASVGHVSTDPASDAEGAAAFLRARGFEDRVERDAEPELPIAFVVTNALSCTVLNFREHVIHLPRPTPVRRGAGA